jgi:hypothetical protein
MTLRYRARSCTQWAVSRSRRTADRRWTKSGQKASVSVSVQLGRACVGHATRRRRQRAKHHVATSAYPAIGYGAEEGGSGPSTYRS